MRHIVHMDLDTFFVSVERLRNSKLVGLPVIIGGGSDRGVVASCSYEARKLGVHSAMPIRQARQLCPNGMYIRGDMEAYSKYSRVVTDVIADMVPLYEKASIDEFYIDLTGMDKFFGIEKFAHSVRNKIMTEAGLPISFGLSENKTVSKIGTGQAKPNGPIAIEHGTEKSFLAPLSISKIPMIGEVTFKTLRSMGIARIETLQQMPIEMMERVMGKHGIMIWKKANGIDNNPVEPYNERKSISTETTFETDTIDVQRLRNILVAMVEKIAFKLRKEGKLTSCVTVKLRYSNFDTFTQQCQIPYSSSDHLLLEKAHALFDKLYNRRLLIRLIGVRFSGLVQGTQQINLFDNVHKTVDLYLAMDKLRKRFGDDAIQRAAGLGEL